MISTARGIRLVTETVPEKQAAMINKLSEEDAKFLLKIALRIIRGQSIESDTK